MTTKIGTYRDIIYFGNIVKVSDGMGGYTESFLEKCSARGRAITSASEITVDGDVRNVYNYTFECRYLEGIYPDMVMKLNTEPYVWKIKDVIDPSGKRERLTFVATREVEKAIVSQPASQTNNNNDSQTQGD